MAGFVVVAVIAITVDVLVRRAQSSICLGFAKAISIRLFGFSADIFSSTLSEVTHSGMHLHANIGTLHYECSIPPCARENGLVHLVYDSTPSRIRRQSWLAACTLLYTVPSGARLKRGA